MKRISETKALRKVLSIKTEFAERIRESYERKAKSCTTCETKGACCLDAHFVNVHVSRLETAAICERLNALPTDQRTEVYDRIDKTIIKYGLSDSGDTFAKTYACPLFEKGTGCLVHASGKPLPCIAHACYEKREDLPPGELLAEQEIKIDVLNERIYGKPSRWLPLPIAIRQSRLR